MITIADILNNERFSGLKLINSQANLDREILTIESTETPDISNYLAPNSFLLTTAMVYKDDQSGLCDLIIELNNLPCAALGIKLGRFVNRLDDKVIELADRLNFPLIQIPLDMTLGYTFHQLLSYMWDNQNEQLLYSLNIQKKFSNLMIRDASLDMLIQNLAHTLKKSIALVDPFGNITNYTENKKSKYPKELLRKIVEELSRDEGIANPIKVKIDGEHGVEGIASIYTINMASYYPHYLIVFDSENMAFPISAMAIDQALLILAFTLYKNLRISYNILSNKEELFRNLISFKTHEILNEDQLLFKGNKHKLKLANSYQIVICDVPNKNQFISDATVLEEWYTLVYDWLDNKLHKDIEGSILFPDRENYRFIILLQGTTRNLVDRLSSYKGVLDKTIRLDMSFYVGNIVPDITSIKYSYKEALESMDFGDTQDGIKFIYYYRQLGTFELLNLLPQSPLNNYISYTLKTLAYPENEMLIDLRNTLKVYLDLNCNITDTSNALFVHRNTVKYRIEKCEEILGHSIKNPNYSLNLRLSLMYTEMHNKKMTP